MVNILIIILVSLLSMVVFLYLLWIIIPDISGLPWIPTQPQRIRRALELAQLKPGDLFYDLGSGDGRALIMAARDFGVQAIGVEISPIHCFFSWLNVLFHGVQGKVKIKWASFYTINFSNANVIFAYLTSREASRLRPHLEALLKSGTRIVTVSCEIEGWQPTAINREELLFLYVIPPLGV
jgi:SAM-dependent methyltransferase